MEKVAKKFAGRSEYDQVSATTERSKGKKGFAHPTEGYKAEVSQEGEKMM